MKIIKLTIEPTKEQSNAPAETLSEQAKELFDILEKYNTIIDLEVIESDIDIFYILIDEMGINSMVNFFINTGITIKIEDVSKQVINGTFQLPTNEENIEQFNEMKKMFFQTQVEVDDILDKISEFGIESLTELDKQILQA